MPLLIDLVLCLGAMEVKIMVKSFTIVSFFGDTSDFERVIRYGGNV
jgi:hypothetical protein